ncbi:MAG: heterodisulfide reductase-related iron-sulfur binding cluster, partial [Actinomycetota bacterium]|nr:heterodisulfide reductase-related iron-sulfur binding cluster [Actinomycetota bacterium]
VFQGLATQNAETLKEHRAKKVVSTCAHCFNTLKNEYAEFGIELEVVHHTQLLNRLVREKRLTPVSAGTAAGSNGGRRSITYHDPCYLGRHNRVYSPPRELLDVIPDAELTEMPRNSERSFCCGAGGARMWMEENIGERINVNRTKEAIATGADQIAVACPFCRVMLADGLTAQQAAGEAREEVEVLDVAQLLLASVRGEGPKVRAGTPAGAQARSDAVATAAEPAEGDATQTAQTVTDTEDVGPAAKASGGSSLFDIGSDTDSPKTDSDSEPAPASETAKKPTEPETAPAPRDSVPQGGSLFDISASAEGEPPTESGATDETEAEIDRSHDDAEGSVPQTGETTPEAQAETAVPHGGSLFDIPAPTEDEPPTESGATEDTEAEIDRSHDDADNSVPNTDESAPVRSLKEIKAQYADPGAPGAEAPKSNDDRIDEAEKAPSRPPPDSGTAVIGAEEQPAEDQPAPDSELAPEPKKEIGKGSLFDL